MSDKVDTLVLLIEIIVAFVAFSSIVASIKSTLGQEVTPHQRLLVHFFTESGMLAASICLLPFVLLGFISDEELVTRITCIYTLLAVFTYLSWYLRRRFLIRAPTPIGSVVTIIGWALWLPVLGITAADAIWEPNLAIIAALGYWSITSSTIVFVTFLATFVDDIESA